MHDQALCTSALQVLQEKYRQTSELVQNELGAILHAPALKMGDASAFHSFALSAQSLIGMLKTLDGQNGNELHCGSHVNHLLSKMSPTYHDGFKIQTPQGASLNTRELCPTSTPNRA